MALIGQQKGDFRELKIENAYRTVGNVWPRGQWSFFPQWPWPFWRPMQFSA